MDDISDINRFSVESYQMMVDSRTRDTSAFPDANNYVVDFSDNPFKNVVGVQLLTGSVPRTNYVVDVGYNKFAVAFGEAPYPEANIHVLTMTPGDYNLPQLCDQMNSKLTDAGLPLVASPFTNPAEITNKFAFTGSGPFALFLDRLSLGGKIGFGSTVRLDDVDAGYYEATPTWKATRFQDANVYVAVEQTSTTVETAFLGPIADAVAKTVVSGVTYSQRFTPIFGGIPSSLTVSLYGATAGMTISASVTTGAVGASPVATGISTISSNSSTSTVVSFVHAVGGGTIQPAFGATFVNFTVSGTCTLAIDRANLAPDPLNAILENGVVVDTTNSICGTLNVYVSGYRVVSPGVADLTGDRFLLVRCPEVESFLFRGNRRASGLTHPGIGLLTLGTYGFTDIRNDFFNSKPPQLQTPIGRLSKMTIQLESQNGNLYSTRGCDHTLLIDVKYLVPKIGDANLASMPSILSPGYTQDQWKYINERQAQARPNMFGQITGY